MVAAEPARERAGLGSTAGGPGPCGPTPGGVRGGPDRPRSMFTLIGVSVRSRTTSAALRRGRSSPAHPSPSGLTRRSSRGWARRPSSRLIGAPMPAFAPNARHQPPACPPSPDRIAATIPIDDVGQWVWRHGDLTWIATGTLAVERSVTGLVATQQAAEPTNRPGTQDASPTRCGRSARMRAPGALTPTDHVSAPRRTASALRSRATRVPRPAAPPTRSATPTTPLPGRCCAAGLHRRQASISSAAWANRASVCWCRRSPMSCGVSPENARACDPSRMIPSR